MKLKSTTFLTLCGVMQGVGAMVEDPSGGFARGGQGSPYFDQEVNDFVSELYQRAGAFLLGNHAVSHQEWRLIAQCPRLKAGNLGSWGAGSGGPCSRNQDLRRMAHTTPHIERI